MNSRSIAWLVGGLLGAAVVIAGLVCLRVFVAIPYRLPTASMYPTIRRNDVVWCYKLAYADPADIKRGDLVVHYAEVNGAKSVYVKRVVGLPGDHVRTAYDRVFVNGRELPHELLRQESEVNIVRETNGAVSYDIAVAKTPPRWRIPDVDATVPPGQFFMLGDNRMNSLDSRYVGSVRWDDVIGKIVFGAGSNLSKNLVPKMPF